MQMPSTRSSAKQLGCKTYLTGKECPQGHVAERRTHNGECVECGRDMAREKARQLDRTVKAERDRRHHALHRDRILAQKRRYYTEKKLEIRKRAKPRDAAWNAGDGKQYKRQWSLENKDRKRIYKQRRRAQMRQADGRFCLSDIRRIFEAQKGRCACCGSKEKLTIDHIIPLARGGSNWPSNIQGLCAPCNRRKWHKDPIAFMREMGALL